METAADVIQDLVAGYLKKSTLTTTCMFPKVNEKIKDILTVVE